MVLDVICGGVWIDKRFHRHRCGSRLSSEHGNYSTKLLQCLDDAGNSCYRMGSSQALVNRLDLGYRCRANMSKGGLGRSARSMIMTHFLFLRMMPEARRSSTCLWYFTFLHGWYENRPAQHPANPNSELFHGHSSPVDGNSVPAIPRADKCIGKAVWY